MISGLIAENALTAINKAALSDSIDSPKALFRAMEAPPGIGPGIKVLQTSALPLGYVALTGAENEIRTRDPLLGKEVLYH